MQFSVNPTHVHDPVTGTSELLAQGIPNFLNRAAEQRRHRQESSLDDRDSKRMHGPGLDQRNSATQRVPIEAGFCTIGCVAA